MHFNRFSSKFHIVGILSKFLRFFADCIIKFVWADLIVDLVMYKLKEFFDYVVLFQDGAVSALE